MRKKLRDDINEAELLSMRDEGMSNQEIAESLDVSYATVLRLIGKQPLGMRGSVKNRSVIEPAQKKRELEEEPIIPACLAVTVKRLTVEGELARYELSSNVEDIMINFKHDNECVLVKKEQIPALIKELQAIQRHLSEIEIGFGVW